MACLRSHGTGSTTKSTPHCQKLQTGEPSRAPTLKSKNKNRAGRDLPERLQRFCCQCLREPGFGRCQAAEAMRFQDFQVVQGRYQVADIGKGCRALCYVGHDSGSLIE